MASTWEPIALPGCEGIVQGEVVLPVMSRAEAQECIDRVKGHWQAFGRELAAFHRREGWAALGYESFSACVQEQLGFSQQRASQFLQAMALIDRLRQQHVLLPEATRHVTEAHARVLQPLPPDAQAEIARRTNFEKTSAPKLRETVDRAKAVLERLDDEQPDWDAVVSHVEQAPTVQNAKLAHDYSVAVCRVTDRLLELDPESVAGVLDDPDRRAALDFIGELRDWCARFETALQRPVRLLPEGGA